MLTHTHLDHIGRAAAAREAGLRRARSTARRRPASSPRSCSRRRAPAGGRREPTSTGRSLTKHEPALPLFDAADVEAALERFGRCRSVRTGTCLARVRPSRTARPATCSARPRSTCACARTAATSRVLFSGDVGRFDAVLAQDPEPAPEADYLVVESTYGNRSHAGRCRCSTSSRACSSAPSRAAACC